MYGVGFDDFVFLKCGKIVILFYSVVMCLVVEIMLWGVLD